MGLGEEDFPLTGKLIYLDTAANGVSPSSTIKVMEDYVRDRCNWLRGAEEWGEGRGKWSKKTEESKGLFAQIIGAKEKEIAFIPNSSTGINTVFSMIPIKSGQNVVATSISYPMGATVCLKQRERGVEARFTENRNGIIGVEDFRKLIDDKTAAVLVDQAGWYNGLLHDLKAVAQVAHDHGAYLVVDGVQSAGASRLDVDKNGVDFLAASTYKWLLGGPSSNRVGFLYVNEEHIDAFQPMFVGNQTLKDAQLQTNISDKYDLYDFEYRRGMRRFQIYPPYEFAYVAVGNSMRVLLERGIENIERRIKKLGTLLVEGLVEAGLDLQTPTEEAKRLYVNVKVKNYRELERELYKNKIKVSARVGGLRVSPHFYNKEEEIEAFLAQLKELPK